MTAGGNNVHRKYVSIEIKIYIMSEAHIGRCKSLKTTDNDPRIVKSHSVYLNSSYTQWIHEIKERYRST